MNFAYSVSEEGFRDDVRAFIRDNMSPEVSERLGLLNSPERRAFMRKLGEKGWLAIGWPAEYGGTFGTTMMRVILNEELAYAGAPNIGISIISVGQAILKHGSEALKSELLPGILRGEVLFAFGYSEPDAGSDLAALRTMAVQVGDDFVVNGVKKFITPAHYADYMWTAVRTDSDAERHAGISLICIPLASSGIEISPLESLGQWRTNEVRLNDVHVSKRFLVGELNGGWKIISSALADERLYPFGPLRRSIETLMSWAVMADEHDARPIDDVTSKRTISRLIAKSDAAESLYMRQLTAIVAARESGSEAAMNKVSNTELDKEIQDTALNLIGEDGLIHGSSHCAIANGVFELDYRVAGVGPIGAGTNEIQKNILAKRLLRR